MGRMGLVGRPGCSVENPGAATSGPDDRARAETGSIAAAVPRRSAEPASRPRRGGSFETGPTTTPAPPVVSAQRRADRVVVIDAGLVVADGEPAELLAVDGPLRRLAARDAAGDSMR